VLPAQRPAILLVDDDATVLSVLSRHLTREGFEVRTAPSGPAALAALSRGWPSIVVVDLMMPGMDGFELSQRIKRIADLPIIVLSAVDADQTKVDALQHFAEDYVVKPFSPKELVARVRAVLRRTNGATTGAEVLRAADVEIDLPKMRARVAGRAVDLTPTEFHLLATFVRELGRVFTRGQLLDALHGVTVESYERAIDAHVKNLRRKIEPEVGRPRYILTVHGVGYRFADD